MKALGLAGFLMVVGLGSAASAEPVTVSAEQAATLAPRFLPGPPIWQPPELRPKAIGASSLEEAVDRCVGDAMALAHTPGAAAAVIVDGEMVYEQGYGIKRRGGSEPVDAETQFRIGSVTKMLTAAAVMQQVEAGRVSLDDSLSMYVPEAEFLRHFSAEAITIHRLMTHATGIPDLQFQANGDTGPGALSDWAETLSTIGLHASPGAFWNYSNPNFNLAGLVVERASGSEFRSYMGTHVFGPAGMTATTFDPAAVMARGNASHGHFDDGSGAGPVYAPDSYDNHVYASVGTSQSFIPYPITGAVSVDSHGRLSVHFWDPAGSWSQLWDLEHVGYDTFVTDIDYDGDYDLDVSFLTGQGSPERTRWLRMRQIVGYRQVDPRHGSR